MDLICGVYYVYGNGTKLNRYFICTLNDHCPAKQKRTCHGGRSSRLGRRMEVDMLDIGRRSVKIGIRTGCISFEQDLLLQRVGEIGLILRAHPILEVDHGSTKEDFALFTVDSRKWTILAIVQIQASCLVCCQVDYFSNCTNSGFVLGVLPLY